MWTDVCFQSAEESCFLSISCAPLYSQTRSTDCKSRLATAAFVSPSGRDTFTPRAMMSSSTLSAQSGGGGWMEGGATACNQVIIEGYVTASTSDLAAPPWHGPAPALCHSAAPGAQWPTAGLQNSLPGSPPGPCSTCPSSAAVGGPPPGAGPPPPAAKL